MAMPEPPITRLIWFGGILASVWFVFSVGHYLVGHTPWGGLLFGPRPHAVVIGIAWGLAAWRRGSWWP